MKRDLSGDVVIAMLDLSPHPEGGHYRETFRDTAEPGNFDRYLFPSQRRRTISLARGGRRGSLALLCRRSAIA